MTEDQSHQPVMLSEVLEVLEPRQGESYLDLTAGRGGHAAAILASTRAEAVLVDRDPQAAAYLRQRFAGQVTIIRQDFLTASQELMASGRGFDLLLADLGVSSPQLENPERGFAFARSGPLDMRMDPSTSLTADEIVNRWDQPSLIQLLRLYGEEPQAGRIAEAIRQHRPIQNTDQLASIVAEAVGRHGKHHPATRTFQALRIAVNDELQQLSASLPLWLQLLNPDGRMAVISFHSLEDRLVKQFFTDYSGDRYDAELKLLTKKPLVPSPNEIAINPRARSAKLRACRKNKNRKE